MHHAVNDHGVDDVSDIVNSNVSDDRGLASLFVDFDLCDVGTEWPSEVLRVEEADSFQSGFHTRWEVLRGVRCACNFAPWDLLLLHVLDVEDAVLKDDLFGVGFHLMRGDSLCLIQHLVEAHHQCLAANC